MRMTPGGTPFVSSYLSAHVCRSVRRDVATSALHSADAVTVWAASRPNESAAPSSGMVATPVRSTMPRSFSMRSEIACATCRATPRIALSTVSSDAPRERSCSYSETGMFFPIAGSSSVTRLPGCLPPTEGSAS